jgi:Fe-S-cluster containining protein
MDAGPRQCGSCSLCCKVLGVAALDKPEQAWCVHCKPGRGCAIYATRPQECRTFGCLWLADDKFPESLKPDACKIVFAVEGDGARISAYVDRNAPQAWRRPDILAMLRRMAAIQEARKGQVVVFIGKRAIAVLPDREVDLGEVDKAGQMIVYARDPHSGTLAVRTAPAGG